MPRDHRNQGVLRRHRLVTSTPGAPALTDPVANHTRTGMSTRTTATTRSRCRCRFILMAVGLAVIIVVLHPARAQRPTLIATRQILSRAVLLLASWAIGLILAAWIVPRVSLSVPGFIVAVVVFAVTQAILSLSILKLPYRYAPLLLGGTGLALTIVALTLASILTHGLIIEGIEPWLATTVVVWLVTTIGAITLPELLIRGLGPARPDQIHGPAHTGGWRWSASRFCISPGPRSDLDFAISSDDGGSGDGRHA